MPGRMVKLRAFVRYGVRVGGLSICRMPVRKASLTTALNDAPRFPASLFTARTSSSSRVSVVLMREICPATDETSRCFYEDILMPNKTKCQEPFWTRGEALGLGVVLSASAHDSVYQGAAGTRSFQVGPEVHEDVRGLREMMEHAMDAEPHHGGSAIVPPSRTRLVPLM